MHQTRIPIRSAVLLLGLVAACERPPQHATAPTMPGISAARVADQQDTALLRRVNAINAQLAAQGFNIAVEGVDFFTIGNGRPGIRIHQAGLRWVPNDPRRFADGTNITYLVNQSTGTTLSGLSAAQTEAAIDGALATWGSDPALKKVQIIKRPDPGQPDLIFAPLLGFGSFGFPFFADIVEAGFYPRALFEAVGGPSGGRGILAFSISFIFVDGNGNPTDINGDNYLDTALNEVYWNNTFGDPGSDRAGNPWAINQSVPAIDVQTVALHENGHSLELGHFGPPPAAVMNPVYAGIRLLPLPPDDAGMNAVWGSWPNP